MKKFLLALAVCGLAASASADDQFIDFNDCFALSFEGQPVAAGATIKATHFEDVSDLYGDGTVRYSLDIKVENLDIMPQYMRGVLQPSQPTMKDYLSNRYYWGEPQLCYTVMTPTGPTGNCLAGDPNNLFNPNFGNGICEIPVVDEFEWQIHVNGCDANATAVYKLILQGVEVDDPNNSTQYTAITTPVELLLDFSAAAPSGIDGIAADDSEGVYYDLQGRRVANPSKGLYIYKTSGKAVKRLVK